jgi:hypothetical protein
MNVKQKYFLASFRGDKIKPEDFNLNKVDGTEYYSDKLGNHWKQVSLWDNGWGNESGFIKLPEPTFEELWTLLIESNVFENYNGASEIINSKYPFELKNKLQELFNKNQKLNWKLTKRIKLLELGINRNEVIGVSKEKVEKDFTEWKKLKTDFERLSKKKFWFF